MDEYGSQNYWTSRYNKDKRFFDWYCTFDDLKPLLAKYIAPRSRVVEVGCGTSPLCFQLCAGFDARVSAYDRSEEAIQLLTDFKGTGWPGLELAKAEAATLPLEDGTADVIIDKGCLDTILTGDDALVELELYLRECVRCLRVEGLLLLISVGPEASRTRLFDTAIEELELPLCYETEKLTEERLQDIHVYIFHRT